MPAELGRGTLKVPPNCDALNDDGFPTAVVNRHMFIYKGSSGQQQLDPFVSVFKSNGDASAAMHAYIGAVARCKDELLSALKSAFSANGWTEIGVALDVSPAPSGGDESTMYRGTYSALVKSNRVSGQYDLVILRVGSIVAAVTYVGADDTLFVGTVIPPAEDASRERLSPSVTDGSRDPVLGR